VGATGIEEEKEEEQEQEGQVGHVKGRAKILIIKCLKTRNIFTPVVDFNKTANGKHIGL
jgi:hypothetical protein